MAQQVGALRFKGKVGNVVGFGNSASEKVNKNFVRQQASSVANPKTYKQAEQRSKVKPAAAFYSAFENVLNHAFLPSQRASKNRNMFMKKAMTQVHIPDVRKDDNYLPVVPYQISEGNLGLDYLTVPENKDVDILSFKGMGINDDSQTVAEYTAAILTAYPELEAGQELTFIGIIGGINDKYVRQASHFSVVLDPNDTITTMADVVAGSAISCVDDGGDGYLMAKNQNLYVLLAGGLIISSKTSASWRYTKSFMYLTDVAKALPNIESDVILSYMSAESSATSDKILQQANNSSVANVVIISTTTAAITNATGYSGTLTPANATVAVYNNGSRAVVTMMVDGEEVLAYKNGTTWTSIKRTGAGDPPVETPVTLASTNLAGNRTVDYSAVVARGL